MDAGDDAAVLGRQDASLALTVDTLVEGIHFTADTPAPDVGFKSVAVSVSDLAATGARPMWMLCSVSMPRDQDPSAWTRGFAAGLAEACRTWGLHLVGGDVTSVPAGGPRVVSNTLGGRVVASPLTRSGARSHDILWVTGRPGLAGAGWMLSEPPAEAVAALRRPRPPLRFALALAERGLARAAMDLSDGLAADLPRLASASGVRLVLEPARLPAPAALADHPELRRCQLLGGDDYELLLCAPPDAGEALRALAAEHHVELTAVGHAEAGRGVVNTEGPWPWPAFEHFAAADRPGEAGP